ncbi:MAG: hypothetical protein ACJ8G7_07525 [Rhizobacter sp.]
MRITIVNLKSQDSHAPAVDIDHFQAGVRAINRQVMSDFEPEWGGHATLVGVSTHLRSGRLAPIQGNREAIIYVGRSHDDPTTGVEGALGYHSTNHKGVAYGFVYLDIVKEFGDDWCATLSHEVLETLADPSAMLTVKGPSPKDHTKAVFYDLEVCDPTQGDAYHIDGLRVSNFVGRAYFGLAGGSGKTNFLDLPLVPLGVRPGGYFQYEDAHGGVHQVDGDKVSRAMLAAKAKIKDGRRLTRRAEFIERLAKL